MRSTCTVWPELFAPIQETVRLVVRGSADEGFGDLHADRVCRRTVHGCLLHGRRTTVRATSPPHVAWRTREPELFDQLIALLIDATVVYLSAQIDAGTEAVMLFDSWAGLLPPSEFRRHVIQPTRAIVAALRKHSPTVPIIGFPRLAGQLIGEYAEVTRVDGVGIDTSMDLGFVGRTVQPATALQGNLDPLALVAGGRCIAA